MPPCQPRHPSFLLRGTFPRERRQRGYLIDRAAGGGYSFTRPDGSIMPACPQLPAPTGSIGRWHDAEITDRTIIPAGLGDNLNLDLAIWACFANARLAAEQRQAA